jgi:uncharacterized protein (DUF983 family)
MRIRRLVGIAALLILSALALAADQPAGASTTPGAPPGWIAHSAYGLQLSVPKSWSVEVFGQCPKGGPGTLFIGTTQFVDNCPAYGWNATQVDMYRPDALSALRPLNERSIRVHGLLVRSSKNHSDMLWIVPSRNVVISGSGPKAQAIMKTLTLATRHANPASGMVSGSEYVEAIEQMPVTGPVTVTMPVSGKKITVTAFYGRFWFSGTPGRYVLNGHAGIAPCPPVSVTILSGEKVNAPPIRCQGF